MRGNLEDQTCILRSRLHTRLRCVLALVAFVCLETATPQQQPSPPPDFRIRISVNLVQVEATVTDSSGKPVSDLGAGDFPPSP